MAWRQALERQTTINNMVSALLEFIVYSLVGVVRKKHKETNE